MYLNFEKPAAISTFDNEIKILDNNKGDTMGIQERVKQFIEQQGVEKGIEIGKHSTVENLLLHSDFDLQKIAFIAGTTLAFVERVKAELTSKPNQ